MGENQIQTHVIAVLVEHKPGVLFRVSNMFTRRGFNIESISVGPTERSDVARMTITVRGDEWLLEQVVKQLNKLMEVIKVSILDAERMVARELALVRVNATESTHKSDIKNYTEIYRGRIVDASHKTLTIEIVGDPDRINAFIKLMRPYGIKEIARTGITALSRDQHPLKS